MKSLLLVLSCLLLMSFTKIDNKLSWVQSAYPDCVEAFEIINFVEHYSDDSYFKDVVYACIIEESEFNKFAVGDKHKHPRHRSYGLMQILPKTAKILAGCPVSYTELTENIELNISMGMDHLHNVGSVNAYNAGPTGMKLGKGCRHARKVLARLKKLPWAKKNKQGVLDEKYYRWFNFRHCSKLKCGSM
jgi:hypothetical protein